MRKEIYRYPELDSTNLECRRLAQTGASHGTVVIADHQTAGRGRLGRSFESPAGLGLYLSILWRPHCAPEKLLPLTALAAVAARRAIRRVCGIDCAVKWPNDLVLRGKKVAGILTESVLGVTSMVDSVIVGIGINLRQRPGDFSFDVAAIASSLETESGTSVDGAALADALITELDVLYADVLPHPERWLTEYRGACLNLGREVQVIFPDGTRRRAEALDIDERFGLTVQYPEGAVETLRSGEVSVRGLYGYAE